MSAKLPESKLPVERSVGRVEGELPPEDFYMDGVYVVFTAAYHLKRGYCCKNGCRHCPYDPE